MKASNVPNLPGESVRGVAWLSSFLRDKLQGDPLLRSIAIRGEVSNCKVSAYGNLNFALTEGTALLQCFAWEDDFLAFPEFKNGAKIVALGSISTYPQRSTYQLVVERVRLEGLGDVHQLFEERKKRLAAEGLFDAARKRALPAFPFRVALVSSKRSEGATDFLTRLRQLRPHVRVEWCETSVQGPNAPAEIVGAIGRAAQLDVDLIVVTRGGGSFEDLFTFSDESVVRAIARARHPVISAVGHTVDQQLADFAADLHAETPSAAAERVGSETRALRERLEDRVRRARGAASRNLERLESRLGRSLTRSKLDDVTLFLLPQQQLLEDAGERLDAGATVFLRTRRERIARLGERLARFDPRLALANRGRRLAETSARLERAARERLRRAELRVRTASATLNGNDPAAILQKGYAIVTLGGRIVREPDEVPIGASIDARVARGTLSARVESKRRQGTTDGNERSG
jgi:exodeoxyribonuclease VII large subunit